MKKHSETPSDRLAFCIANEPTIAVWTSNGDHGFHVRRRRRRLHGVQTILIQPTETSLIQEIPNKMKRSYACTKKEQWNTSAVYFIDGVVGS